MRKAWGLVLLMVLAVPSWGGQTPLASPPAKGPRISVEPASFDFGKALQNRTLQKEFSIRNFGTEDLAIEHLSTDCGCTAALMQGENKTVKPGGSAPLRVSLQTRSALGRLVKKVLVRSNDPTRSVLEIKVEATVVAGK